MRKTLLMRSRAGVRTKSVSSENRPLHYFVPRCTNGSYYHFITESALGLYRMLAEHNQLRSKKCHLWYNGGWGDIIQMFSMHPVVYVPGKEPLSDDGSIGGVAVKQIHRQKITQHRRGFYELIPLSQYLAAQIPSTPSNKGITLIKRTRRREYLEHDELMSRLTVFGVPIREAQLETMTFADQVNLMRNTHLLIAPHGAGTLNMIFMDPGSKIIELFPSGCYNKNAFTISKIFRHRLLELEGERSGPFHRDPPEEVRTWIERNGWPTRQTFQNAGKNNWADFRTLFRAIRDVSYFSLLAERVLAAVQSMSLKTGAGTRDEPLGGGACRHAAGKTDRSGWQEASRQL
jgi:hypothetical protein